MTKLYSMLSSALDYVRTELFLPTTSMLCDFRHKSDLSALPMPDECARNFPNPAGYATGIEDCTLAGGSMLDGCVSFYERTGDARAAELAERLCEGLLRCAESAADPGFVPRGLCPADGTSHYMDSSRDQYTLFAFGLHRYRNSGLCSDAHRERIAKAARAVAERLERNVTPENGYDMLREDGGRGLVSGMWGDSLGNHETMRLPMLYLFAHETTGDARFLEFYRGLREEALERCLPMTGYWALYTLHQMQSSLRLCWDADPDEAWRERILSVMREVARYTAGLVPSMRTKLKDADAYNVGQRSFRAYRMEELARYAAMGIPAVKSVREDEEDYFVFQSFADLLVIPLLIPGGTADDATVELFTEAFGRIDFARHERNLPVYYFCGGSRMTENHFRGKNLF